MSEAKTLDVVDTEDLAKKVSDVKIFGNPNAWQLICKASSKSQDWMKSTKAMEVTGVGVLVQVSTQQGVHVSEALCLMPKAKLVKGSDGMIRIVASYV